ncbi:MAG: glutamate 5-kinase [Deltaproteobacteria bacterium]|nr:glutamate 5-kinase [Deltaproteobacteria bacterium]
MIEKRKKVYHEVVKKARRVVIKVGSGILRPSFFPAFASEVARLKKNGIEVVLVSSGAIARGMALLKLKKRPRDIAGKQAVAAMGQPLLMRAYAEAFKKRSLKVAQLLLTRDDLEHANRFINARHTLDELFGYGVVPIVNENDSVAVEEIKVGDNDQLSALVAHLSEADMLIILTDTDGFHDKDPKRNAGARRLSVVDSVGRKMFGMAKGTLTEKSTGGMITKLKAARIAAGHGIPTWIVNGRNAKVLEELFTGIDVGTLFLAKK